MSALLFKLFIKNDNLCRGAARKSYGVLASYVGIVLNVLLFAAKLFVGLASNSASALADALNNLSDTGSSLVSLLGFKMAGKPSDEKHPFGHGRVEYIAALVVSFIIILMGIELVKTSIGKIVGATETVYSPPMIVILALTIPVKLWLFSFYKRVGKIIGSHAMHAAGADSLNDVLATGVVILSALTSALFGIQIDGYVGALVALFVIYSGVCFARDTLNPLLGQHPDPEIVAEIERRILECNEISGIHDLIVHNYGPGSFIASAHAEVLKDGDLLKIHDMIDLVEREIYAQMGIPITIHIDPIDTDDSLTKNLKDLATNVIREIDPSLSIHDFRIVNGKTHTNLIFDLSVPENVKKSNSELQDEIDRRIAKEIDNCYTVIIFDRNYI